MRAVVVAAVLTVVAAPAAVASPRVLVTGDSMVQPLDKELVRPIRRAGGRTIRDPRPGTDLTKPSALDWVRHAKRQVKRHRPTATVMFIGANDFEALRDPDGHEVQCCRRAWIAAYARRVGQMMSTYRRGGRAHVYWLTLPAPRNRDVARRIAAVNAAIVKARQAAASGVRVVDTVPVLTPGYRYRRRMRYRGRTVVVRDEDGVHLTPAGARVVRDVVVRAMRRDGVLGIAHSAAAATVTLEYEPPLPGIEPTAAYTLTVRDRAGVPNRLSLNGDRSAYLVHDAAAPVMAGRGCRSLTPQEVRCATPKRASDRTVFVDAGGGADVVGVGSLSPVAAVEIRGGRGGDLLVGASGRDLLIGGRGGDWLAGRSGDDRLDGGGNSDRLDGGVGRDQISYASRQRAVTVDLAAGIGGRAGERDVLTGIEDVLGGRAADRLSGDRRPNTLEGGSGNARDVVVGRAGSDTLIGYRAAGGAGNDRIDARVASCGPGSDLLERLLHRTRGPFPRACEIVLADFVLMRRDPVGRSRRRVVFAFKCVFGNLHCEARLTLRDRRGRLGTRHFRFRAPPTGPFKRVTMRLNRRPAGRIGTLRVRGRKPYDRDRLRIRLR